MLTSRSSRGILAVSIIQTNVWIQRLVPLLRVALGQEKLLPNVSLRHYPGQRRDKRICNEQCYTFPPFVELFQDTAFLGCWQADVINYQYQKKPRSGELAIDVRLIKKLISAMCTNAERILSGVRYCWILNDIFSNHREGFNDICMEIACGLHSLSVPHRHPLESFDLLELAA